MTIARTYYGEKAELKISDIPGTDHGASRYRQSEKASSLKADPQGLEAMSSEIRKVFAKRCAGEIIAYLEGVLEGKLPMPSTILPKSEKWHDISTASMEEDFVLTYSPARKYSVDVELLRPFADHVTHWMPLPSPPSEAADD